jgi:hypothetical protein
MQSNSSSFRIRGGGFRFRGERTRGRAAWWLGARLVVWTVGILVASPLLGQVSQEERERLATRLEAAKAELDPALLPALADSQAALVAQVEATRQDLFRITTPGNASAWMAYLGAEPLVEAIEGEQPLKQQAALAEPLSQRLRRNVPGLDLDAIVALRRRVERLIAAIRFRDSERSIDLLEQQLDRLAGRLRAADAIPSTDDMAALSAILQLLTNAGQADRAIAEVRTPFTHPNLAIRVGESLVEQVIRRPVQRTRPVCDSILGTRLVGEATLDGQVTGRLVASSQAARIDVMLDADFHSRNTGYNGPVQLQTVGDGRVHVTRTLVVDQSGPHFDTTWGTAELATQILCIQHPLKLVRKIAAKKAAQQKPRSEQIATAKLRRQVTSEFAQETSDQLRQPGDSPLLQAANIFERLGLTPPHRDWQTTDDYLVVQIRQGETSQVLAANGPPELAGDYEVVVQIHESLIDNIAATVLAGRTMDQTQIQDLLGKVRPDQPDQAKPAPSPSDEGGEPFEIDFARLRPIILEARDGKLRVGVRGTRFQQGDRQLQRAIEITAQYQPVVGETGGASLQRVGPVDVGFPGGGRLSISQVAIKSSIQRAFADIFPPDVLRLPFGVSLQPAGDLNLQTVKIIADDAWLSVALQKES